MRMDVVTVTGVMLAIATGLTLEACGGGATESSTTTTTTARRQREPTAEEQEAQDAQAGVQIEGLMGTISQHQVTGTMNPRVEGGLFNPCFSQARGVDFLGGSIRLSFRIHVDGSVAWVFPIESSIGHRAVERCITERAQGVRFPRPRGGEAEFSWSFHFDAPSDVRAPVSWDAARLATLLASSGGQLVSQCGGHRGYRVTAYVQPGGSVMAVGVAAQSNDVSGQLDCIANGVSGWRMPDPGSYPAKVSFDL